MTIHDLEIQEKDKLNFYLQKNSNYNEEANKKEESNNAKYNTENFIINKNPNLQLRAEPLNPTEYTSVWNQSTIEAPTKNIFLSKNQLNKKEYEKKKSINKIIFLNFEDDTTRPVLEIDESYLKIISKWYEKCELEFDVEHTETYIPNHITNEELSDVLFKDIKNTCKDAFLDEYLPNVFQYIESNKKIVQFIEKNMNEKPPEIKKEKKKNILNNFGIIIPENMKSLNPESDKNMYIIKPFNQHFRQFLEDTQDTPLVVEKKVESVCAYNDEYNTLYSKFGDNCLMLNDGESEQINTNIIVLFHSKNVQTITIKNPSSKDLHIIENHPEFDFVKLFSISTKNKEVIDFINNDYDTIQFTDIEELNKKLTISAKYIDFLNNHETLIAPTNEEETQVKKYMTTFYDFDTDLNHKMKASFLHDEIINSNYYKIRVDGFKIRLSKYLKDLGLQKKRYNDGHYYYGIYKKPILHKNISIKDVDELIIERNKLIGNYVPL